jgi:hypothetical protein
MTEPRKAGRSSRGSSAAWGAQAPGESRWPATFAVLAALALYVTLPAKLTYGPAWFVPAVELALLVPLMLVAPVRTAAAPPWQRAAAIALIAVVNLANLASLVLLVRLLVLGGGHVIGGQLLLGAAQIWTTNILVFALWYWELDRGGPGARQSATHPAPDFLFPQMVTPACAPPHWAPRFIDYLFVAFTNATAFSPTDTMPLTPWAKMLMLLQASASLLTVALVAARAVNILT